MIIIKIPSEIGGSTALYTAYTVHAIDTIDTVDTGNTVYTIQTALHCLNSSVHACIYVPFLPGMDDPSRGDPSPRGRGGSPPRPALWGGGGFPAPTHPVKLIKTARKLRGKIKARISTSSNRGNK